LVIDDFLQQFKMFGVKDLMKSLWKTFCIGLLQNPKTEKMTALLELAKTQDWTMTTTIIGLPCDQLN
jgi:hypothetical protein